MLYRTSLRVKMKGGKNVKVQLSYFQCMYLLMRYVKSEGMRVSENENG